MNYIHTPKIDCSDDYFGQTVADPYRWLEDDNSPNTQQWVSEQNALTFDYLGQIPYRAALKRFITEQHNYPKTGQPFLHGDFLYFFKNDGLQNQSLLYRRQLETGVEECFLDPNQWSVDGTNSINGLYFSQHDQRLAYTVSEAGSDWLSIMVIDVQTGEPLEPALTDVKFSQVAWLGEEGFYYARYDSPQGSKLSARTDQHKVYFHRVGTAQSEDQLVFGGEASQTYRYVAATVSDNQRFVFLSAADSTSGNKLFYIDLLSDPTVIQPLIDNNEADSRVLDVTDQYFIVYTNLTAPNGKVVAINIATGEWQDLIAEQSEPLDAIAAGGYLFAQYMRDVLSHVVQYDYAGQQVRVINLPGQGAIYGLEGKKQQSQLYYTFTNYITPPTVYALNTVTGESELFQASLAPFDSEHYHSEQCFYTSKDGTRIPMTIAYKKGIKLNGKNPTILYGYGGFDVSLTPSFSPMIASWLALGGIYAVANIRGGGEYGKEWHQAGIQTNKQNVFDDFIAAAEYLIAQNYTSCDYLAIRGGSNGGLLVGACMTQRPDLFKVALPAVGVLDMLRYHRFTAGEGWKYDYGTADQNQVMFEYLHAYSPIHNVQAGQHYPATLVTTADHDDRVVPAHSYKFIAELQNKQAGASPVLIRIDVNAGHGSGMPLSKQIDLMSDVYAFTLHNMQITSLAQLTDF